MRTVSVKSDSSCHVYKVLVDDSGKPVKCNCRGFHEHHKCKHLYRGAVKATGILSDAGRYMVEHEIVKDSDEFWWCFRFVANTEGTNVAISRAITRVYGKEHPLASDFVRYKTRKKR